MAAALFADLKKRGFNAELVTEYAKDKVWEHNDTVFSNQVYILGKQSYRVSRVAGQVDVIITDSPILLSAIYNPDPEIQNELEALTVKMFNQYNNLNIVLKRTFPYQKEGRMHSEEQSSEIYQKIIECLNQNRIGYSVFDNKDDTQQTLMDIIVNMAVS